MNEREKTVELGDATWSISQSSGDGLREVAAQDREPIARLEVSIYGFGEGDAEVTIDRGAGRSARTHSHRRIAEVAAREALRAAELLDEW